MTQFILMQLYSQTHCERSTFVENPGLWPLCLIILGIGRGRDDVRVKEL